MTVREQQAIADAINQRYQTFDPGGAVRFGVEEAVLAISEVLQALDPAFDPTQFKTACFGARDVT
jgi:hypothetical protein